MLDKIELEKIQGGAVNWLVVGGIFGGLFTFLAGLVDGFLGNNACAK